MKCVKKYNITALTLEQQSKKITIPRSINTVYAYDFNNLKISHELASAASISDRLPNHKYPTASHLSLEFTKYLPEIDLTDKLPPHAEQLRIGVPYPKSGESTLVKLGKVDCDTLIIFNSICSVDPGFRINNFVLHRPDKEPLDFTSFNGIKSLYLNYVNEDDIIPEVEELLIFGWDQEMTLPVVNCKILSAFGPVKINPGSKIELVSTFNQYDKSL